MKLGGHWGSPTEALTMSCACQPAHAGHTGVPTPDLARSQLCHPSNHLHGSRTWLFLVESKKLFKDSLPTAACSAPRARVTPSSSPGPAMEVDAHSLRMGFPLLGGPSSATPIPGGPEYPLADTFHTPHPCMLKPSIQTVLQGCLCL